MTHGRKVFLPSIRVKQASFPFPSWRNFLFNHRTEKGFPSFLLERQGVSLSPFFEIPSLEGYLGRGRDCTATLSASCWQAKVYIAALLRPGGAHVASPLVLLPFEESSESFRGARSIAERFSRCGRRGQAFSLSSGKTFFCSSPFFSPLSGLTRSPSPPPKTSLGSSFVPTTPFFYLVE